MARPPSPNTVNFLRILSDPQRIILLAAGEGNISRGFENVLSLYQHAHNQGFRPSMPFGSLGIISGTTNNPNSEESLRDKVRESIGNE
jgi:hypothetical protein